MPGKTDTQKQLMASLKRLNFALPREIWARDLAKIAELIELVLTEG